MKQSSGPMSLTLALLLPLTSLVATAQQPIAGLAAAPASTVASGPEKVVTEADNGSAVTLNAGETLVVHLNDNPSTGYSFALVSFPDMPVRLVSQQLLPRPAGEVGAPPVVGAPRVREWKFVPAGEAAYGKTVWLKLLHLRPFAKGVETAGLWEIKVNVSKTPTR